MNQFVLVLMASLVLTSPLQLSFAADTNTDSNDPCAGLDKQVRDEASAQKLRYCQAAEAERHLAGMNKSLGTVWGIVAVTCTYVCAMSFGHNPVSGNVCTIPATGAAIYEITQSHSFTGLYSSVMKGAQGVMGMGGMAMMADGKGIQNTMGVGSHLTSGQTAFQKTLPGAQSSTGVSTKASQFESKVKSGRSACLVAAFAAFQNMGKSKEAGEHRAAADQNTQAAANLNDAKNNNIFNFGNAGSSPTQHIDGSGGSQNLASIGDQNNDAAKGACNKIENGDPKAQVACATAQDKKLGDLIANNPGLFEAANKVADVKGMFKSGVDSASLANGMTASLGSNSASDIREALKNAETDITSGKMLAGGDGGTNAAPMGSGGGHKPAATTESDGLGDFLKGLGQITNPKDDASKQALEAVSFSQKYRGLAGMTEDATLPIFYRVRARYMLIGKQWTSDQPPQSATP